MSITASPFSPSESYGPARVKPFSPSESYGPARVKPFSPATLFEDPTRAIHRLRSGSDCRVYPVCFVCTGWDGGGVDIKRGGAKRGFGDEQTEVIEIN